MCWLFYSNPLLRLNSVDTFCCHKLNPCWLNANFALPQCKFLAQFMLISLFCRIHLCLCNQLIYCSCLLAKMWSFQFSCNTVHNGRFYFKMLKNLKYFFFIPANISLKIELHFSPLHKSNCTYGSLFWFVFTEKFLLRANMLKTFEVPLVLYIC